jgi:hypothetical protein
VHNLTENNLTVKLEKYFDHLIEHFGDQTYGPLSEKTKQVQIGPFGYRWFRKSRLFL